MKIISEHSCYPEEKKNESIFSGIPSLLFLLMFIC